MLVELKNHLAEGCPTTEDFLRSEGLKFHFVSFPGSPVYVIVSYITDKQIAFLKSLPTVSKITQIGTSYQLVSKKWRASNTVVKVKNLEVGGGYPVLVAGPCAVESEQQLYTIASFLAKKGVRFLRGGAYKPRTSPYSFQGLKKPGLEIMRKVADEFDMMVVTELLDLSALDEVSQYADILQVGTRNMHNYQLLRALGKQKLPVLLKRGFSATVEEWLLAAEHILLGGNDMVILCERGIRTFEPATRNTLDLSAVALVKQLSHLPVIVDPSQGTGDSRLITPLSLAAMAVGADGLMVETHNDPAHALSDGQQSLNFAQFEELQAGLRKISALDGRSFDFDSKSVKFTS